MNGENEKIIGRLDGHNHEHQGPTSSHIGEPGCPIELEEIERLLSLADKWADTFKLLGDPTRLRILLVLHYAGPHSMTVTDIAEAVGVRTATASAALRLMELSNVLKSHRRGREMLYELVGPEFHALLHAIGGGHAIAAEKMEGHEEYSHKH